MRLETFPLELDEGTGTVSFDPAIAERKFAIYDGAFDDFHYDIGHGKGTGNDVAKLIDEI